MLLFTNRFLLYNTYIFYIVLSRPNMENVTYYKICHIIYNFTEKLLTFTYKSDNYRLLNYHHKIIVSYSSHD